MIKELLHLLYLSDKDRVMTTAQLDTKSEALHLIEAELKAIINMTSRGLSENQVDETDHNIKTRQTLT